MFAGKNNITEYNVTGAYLIVTQFWKTLHIRTLLDFEKYRFEI